MRINLFLTTKNKKMKQRALMRIKQQKCWKAFLLIDNPSINTVDNILDALIEDGFLRDAIGRALNNISNYLVTNEEPLVEEIEELLNRHRHGIKERMIKFRLRNCF